MAIFDADKVGFLRSTRSLIQTIGRAARNAEGRAILYADVQTDAMTQAIGETDRRRAKQVEHNALHGIVPKTVRKNVEDILEGAYVPGKRAVAKQAKANKHAVAEMGADYTHMTVTQLAQCIKQVEDAMFMAARNLAFEEAARLRDELHQLKELMIKNS